MKTAIKLLCLAYILTTLGCASGASRSGIAHSPTPVYPGAVLDVRLVIDPYYINFSPSGRRPDKLALGPRFLSILDIPFSTIVDTVCLPYDIYTWVTDDDPKQ